MTTRASATRMTARLATTDASRTLHEEGQHADEEAPVGSRLPVSEEAGSVAWLGDTPGERVREEEGAMNWAASGLPISPTFLHVVGSTSRRTRDGRTARARVEGTTPSWLSASTTMQAGPPRATPPTRTTAGRTQAIDRLAACVFDVAVLSLLVLLVRRTRWARVGR